MGFEREHAEKRPLRRVPNASSSIDLAPVTNADFQRFAAQTGDVTLAERPSSPALFGEVPLERLEPATTLCG